MRNVQKCNDNRAIITKINIFATLNSTGVKTWCQSILKYFLIVLFVSYYVGGVAFTHVHHYLSYTIVHSHPYLPGSDGLPHHTHDSVAFQTIEELTHILAESALFFFFGMALIFFIVFAQSPRYLIVIRSVCTCNLRAPPLY